MQSAYLDNNATTQPAPEVTQAMLPYLTEWFGNPSSVHRFGQRARQSIDEARQSVAQLLHCAESELFFTSGGTESINTAVRGIFAARAPRNHIITSTVEHSATRELCAEMERQGAKVTQIPVSRDGSLDMAMLEASIDDTVAVVTVMWANNETGVLFPVDKIAALCRGRGVPFHCDAVQAVGKIPTDLAAMGIDAASFAAHKFHGPKGIGGLFVRRGLRTRPLIIGGPQERGRRGGTENVPGIVGLGKAAELSVAAIPHRAHLAHLRDRLEDGILATIDESVVNGRTDQRVENTTNISFPALEAEAILLLLSEQGVSASAGSACSSGSLEPSPVLRAMKIPDRIAHGAIRFSVGRYTREEEIDLALRVLPGIISRLRAVLPVGAKKASDRDS